MKLQLIRNATLRMEYAGHRFVIDPYLAAKHSRPSFSGKSPNPLVDLPCSPEEVIADAEMVVVSHLHSDHFDIAAQELLPKSIPIFCQPHDEQAIRLMGFREVVAINTNVEWKAVSITRTNCQHGSGEVLAAMGETSGFVFRAAGEPTVYWAGDTIWTEDVAATIQQVQPQVIVTHSSGAVWGNEVLIIMDKAQTIHVCQFSPNSTVIATHMEALDHGTVSRVALKEYAAAHGVRTGQLLIPADGEVVNL
jgi:L-ascorbate metabolism protein UlaG (beta-lactamase superfamily)